MLIKCWRASESRLVYIHGAIAATRRTHLLIFNTELLDLDEDLGDYVIVHELLHFRVPNHGKLWKSLMRPTSAITNGRQSD